MIQFRHPDNHLILPGVTRAVTIEIAASLGIPLREEEFSVSRLMEADEVFVTGTTVEVCPPLAYTSDFLYEYVAEDQSG